MEGEQQLSILGHDDEKGHSILVIFCYTLAQAGILAIRPCTLLFMKSV